MPKLWKDIARPFFRTWNLVRTVIAVILTAYLILVLFSLTGFTDDLETTLDACVIAEDGQVLTCQVYVKGEMTHYPLRPHQDYFYTEPLGTGVRGISINGKPAIGNLSFDREHQDLAVGVSQRGVYFLDRKATLMFGETDLNYLFPDLSSQRCIVAAPASNAEQLRQLIAGQTIPASHAAKFDWLWQE